MWQMDWPRNSLKDLTEVQSDLQKQRASRGGESTGRGPWTVTELWYVPKIHQQQNAQRKQAAKPDLSRHQSAFSQGESWGDSFFPKL